MSEITANTVRNAGRPAAGSPARYFFKIVDWYCGLKAAGLRREDVSLEIAIAEERRQRAQSRVPRDPSQCLAAELRREEMHRSLDRLLLM